MKILQIMPAEKWYASYDGYEVRLVCWALVEDDDGITIVTGMENRSGNILLTPAEKQFTEYKYIV